MLCHYVRGGPAMRVRRGRGEERKNIEGNVGGRRKTLMMFDYGNPLTWGHQMIFLIAIPTYCLGFFFISASSGR